MIRFAPLVIGHAILWLVFAHEALYQGQLSEYIQMRRSEAHVKARPVERRPGQYGTVDESANDGQYATTAATMFLDSDKFRPLMVLQLLLFQSTNVIGPAYFAYVTHKLRYARSRGPIYAVLIFFVGAFVPAVCMPFWSSIFYSLFHYAMFGLWYPLVVAVMIYSAQDKLEAQPERLGADRQRRRGVPGSSTTRT